MTSEKTEAVNQKFGFVLGVTAFAMIAFATNSILCRAALRPEKVDSESLSQNRDEPNETEGSDRKLEIDPATYTVIRVLSGALVLWGIQLYRRKKLFAAKDSRGKPKWLPPLMLSSYALCFSFAYIGLDTASGTLILFAFVQLTMIVVGLVKKEVPGFLEWIGLSLASGGLVYLLLPNIQTPLLKESMLMAAAGVSWGVYSVLGKQSKDSISDTAFNFVISTPIVFLIWLFFLGQFQVSSSGFFLAVASGGIASGLGYVLWYTVLPNLRSTQAASVQLSVPVIAAVGGVFVVGDQLAIRTILAGLLILVGIGLTIKRKKS